MHIEKSFLVRAAPDTVWSFLSDPYRVAGCLPGAAITGTVDERTYTGTITVKVGPVSTSYRGEVRFDRLDAAARTAEIVATGQDVRGKGGADLRMSSRVIERGPLETEVTVVQAINVTGMLAQLGRGMIQDVGDQLFERFTSAMRGQLEATSTTPAQSAAQTVSESAQHGAPERVPRVVQAAAALSVTTPAQDAAEPIQVVSFGAGVAGRALGRAVRRPVAWAVIAVLFILLWFWVIR